MLQEDVKVFLCEHRFESFNTVGQGKKSLPRLQGSTGSFRKFLGDRRDGTKVFRSRIWENPRHEKSIPLLVFNLTYLEGGLIFF